MELPPVAELPPVELPPVAELPPVELPPESLPPVIIIDTAQAIVLSTVDVKDASTDETLAGASAADLIVGGAGNDVISGQGGDDTLIGDEVGTITVALNIDAALINAANEHDYRLTLTGVPDGALLSGGAQNQDGSWTLTADDLPGLTMTGPDAGDFTLHVEANATDGSGLSTTADLNVSLANGNNDLISGNAGNDTLYGNGGDDVMYGAGKWDGTVHEVTVADDDVLFGGAGNDVMYGNSGDDKMYGEADNDTMFGGKGNDRMTDGDGNDVVYGNSGNDLMMAGEGDDGYNGNSGFDTIDFSAAKQGMKIDLSKKTADGMGHDTISGFESVIGSSFDDTMKGSKNAETLNGADGNDVLRGMGGADTLSGGPGNDTYVWMAKDVLDDKGNHLGVDRVLGFEQGDKLDLREILKGHAANFMVTDDVGGTTVSAKIGGQFVDVAVLDGVHGHTADEMLKAGMILA